MQTCAGGAYVKASVAYGRNTSTLYDLTNLTEIPTISEDTDLEKLVKLRSEPLPGEQQVMWAIQRENEPGSRQVLPDWIAKPLVSQLLKWTQEKRTWSEKIAERPNNKLAPASQRKYDEWIEKSQEKRLLYNKTRRTVVAPEAVTDLNALKKLRANLFLVTLKLTDDVSKLQIAASDGECRQLVALRGEPTEDTEQTATPDFLRKEVPESDLDHVDLEPLEEQPDEVEMGLNEDRLAEGDEPEAPAVMESDLMEILALPEDEFEEAPRHSKVKSFMHRPSYRKLARHGLVDIPTTVPGTSLGCHGTRMQWQAFFPGARHGLSFSWGGKTHRTEEEALIKCIKGLLTAFTERFPREKLWSLGPWTMCIVYTYIHRIYLGSIMRVHLRQWHSKCRYRFAKFCHS